MTDRVLDVRRTILSLVGLLGLLIVGCGEGSGVTVGIALERYCRYDAASEDDEANCFDYATEHGFDKLMHREEWGSKAQAVLYALGEIKDCLSRSGPRCKPPDWPDETEGWSLLVRRYCAYGSISYAQMIGCNRHVTPSTVRTYSTNAEQYAVGDQINCGYDAGPFCVE
jgi:hypothetical protein